eukprot:TRINITY_DN3335_c0_g1_i2.p1 TRINITY_DN3335_c0_g1~~TRINITY_DN3335_c0_g1_i2.p1  ORF type:complete len:178 (-),score=14.32 TRINITY_DN3335_c0_g1_i2:81-614(-)
MEGVAPMVYASQKVEKREAAGTGSGLFATDVIHPGELVFSFKGKPTITKSRWTIQVGLDQHLGVVSDTMAADLWQYANHACVPTTRIELRQEEDQEVSVEFRSTKTILQGDSITFSYLSTELDMEEQFTCQCSHSGTPQCYGKIRGFQHLTRDRQERLEPLLLPYLKEFMVIHMEEK